MASGLSSETNTAEDDFLTELKSQFQNEIDLRKTLDSKANTMITISSGISTLLIAIGTFLVSRIVDKNIYYGVSIAILATGIISAVIAILFFIQSYAIRKYKYPMGAVSFFRDGEYDKKSVENVRNLSKREFNDKMISGYLKSIKNSGEQNKKRAEKIMNGQICLIIAIATVGCLIGFILISMGSQLIRLG